MKIDDLLKNPQLFAEAIDLKRLRNDVIDECIEVVGYYAGRGQLTQVEDLEALKKGAR